MNRKSWKFWLIGAVVAVTLSSAAPQANAQWWGYYRPVAYGYGYGYGYGWGTGCGYGSCYSACYTPSYSCYTPCCDTGSWYLGCRPGPIRRLFLGRYRWYYGSGCWGGFCDSCVGCSTDVGCCTDGSVAAPASSATPTPAKKPVAEPAMPDTSSTSAENSGVLTVWVPYDAKVTVNGLETRSSGSRRQFVSYGLKPGFSYKYEVRAEVVRDGQVQEETRTITLTAGQATAVAFGFNTTPAAQVAAAR